MKNFRHKNIPVIVTKSSDFELCSSIEVLHRISFNITEKRKKKKQNCRTHHSNHLKN